MPTMNARPDTSTECVFTMQLCNSMTPLFINAPSHSSFIPVARPTWMCPLVQMTPIGMPRPHRHKHETTMPIRCVPVLRLHRPSLPMCFGFIPARSGLSPRVAAITLALLHVSVHAARHACPCLTCAVRHLALIYMSQPSAQIHHRHPPRLHAPFPPVLSVCP